MLNFLTTVFGVKVAHAGNYVGGATPGKVEAVAFVNTFMDIILFPTIALLSTVALLVFFYGLFEYVINSENEAARDIGRKHIMWGLIGLFIMLSAYAIMAIALNSLGLLGIFDAAQDVNQGIIYP